MLVNPTRERLAALGLAGMAKAFDDQQRQTKPTKRDSRLTARLRRCQKPTARTPHAPGDIKSERWARSSRNPGGDQIGTPGRDHWLKVNVGLAAIMLVGAVLELVAVAVVTAWIRLPVVGAPAGPVGVVADQSERRFVVVAAVRVAVISIEGGNQDLDEVRPLLPGLGGKELRRRRSCGIVPHQAWRGRWRVSASASASVSDRGKSNHGPRWGYLW